MLYIAIAHLCNNMPKNFKITDPRATIFKALSCEHRVHIIEILRYGEHSMSEIAEFLEIHPSVVSRHLGILQAAGLIRSRRQGIEVFYSLASEKVVKLLVCAAEIIEDINKT